VIYCSPPGTSVGFTSAGSPSSSSSSPITSPPIIFNGLTGVIGATGSGSDGVGSSGAGSTGAGSFGAGLPGGVGFLGAGAGLVPGAGFSCGFGAGTLGGFGFPVDPLVELVVEIEPVIVVILLILASSFSSFFSSSTIFSMSFLPPGRSSMTSLASFSAFSTVSLASSIALLSFSIFSFDSSTTFLSPSSISLQSLVYLSSSSPDSFSYFSTPSDSASSLAFSSFDPLLSDAAFFTVLSWSYNYLCAEVAASNIFLHSFDSMVIVSFFCSEITLCELRASSASVFFWTALKASFYDSMTFLVVFSSFCLDSTVSIVVSTSIMNVLMFLSYSSIVFVWLVWRSICFWDVILVEKNSFFY